MKTAICYCSQHHGNTRKVVQAMAEGMDVTLIEISRQPDASLEEYDCIGFASGIYGFSYHPMVTEFARRHLPEGKKVFFVCTYGGTKGAGAKELVQIASERHASLLGEFSCRGWNTFGPFKLIGGTGKGRPNQEDLRRAQEFYRKLAAE